MNPRLPRVVLLSGGSGQRLWPLSNGVRTKAYLRLLPGPDGERESMLRRVLRGLKAAGMPMASGCVVTQTDQLEMMRASLEPQVPVLGEPLKRGTYAAAALAAAYLYSAAQADPEETVAVVPVDTYADEAFYRLLARLPEALEQSGASLALIGTVPVRPSSAFGYIVTEKQGGGEVWRPVARFEEKPAPEQAQRLIGEGALWNCGIFGFRLGFLLDDLRRRGLPPEYGPLLEAYGELPAESFDREITEKTPGVVTLAYPGAWSDLGSWDVLAGELEERVMGAGSVSADSAGTCLVNELPIPAHVIGAPGLIVAASPDGILVADRRQADRIKEVLDAAGHSRRPMISEKRWGEYRVLDVTSMPEGGSCLTRKLRLRAGEQTSYHRHPHSRELWVILAGRGEYMLEGKLHPLECGSTVTIPAGYKHGIRAMEPMEWLEIRWGFPAEDGRGDTERIAMNWDG